MEAVKMPECPSGENAATFEMLQMLSGFQVSQALFAVAKLGIATALLKEPLPVERLAARTKTKADPLARLVRCLVPLGVFRMGGELIHLTALGATLAEGHPGSVHGVAQYWMETHYAAIGELTGTILTGEPAATLFYGMPFFDWISANPARVQIQNKAVACATESLRAGMFDDYQLPPGALVADIGGSDGTLLSQLIVNDPSRQGIVFDLPDVVPAASLVIAQYGLSNRVRIEQGNFFHAVPAADVYVLSFIAHDWDDASCARILRNIARAAMPGARVVIVETVISPGEERDLGKALDLNMLAMASGRERTAQEFAAVLASGGFALERVIPSSTPLSFIEASLR